MVLALLEYVSSALQKAGAKEKSILTSAIGTNFHHQSNGKFPEFLCGKVR